MLAQTQFLLDKLQIRKSRAQKAAFRSWLTDVLRQAGYAPTVETGGTLIKSSNVIAGDPEQASVIFTAHYDTCAVLPFPNFITPQNLFLYLLYQILICVPMFVLAIGAEVLLLALWNDCPIWLAMVTVYAVLAFCVWWLLAGPANKHTANDNTSGVAALLEIALTLPEAERGKAAFLFFDNEEKGLLGSSQYRKRHGKALADTLVVNFDCVSDGDFIQFYPNKALKKRDKILTLLEQSFPSSEPKQVQIVRGLALYPSDQRAFPCGVGVAAMHRGPFGYWLGRIHTGRDTVFQTENIELLRAGALSLVSRMHQ